MTSPATFNCFASARILAPNTLIPAFAVQKTISASLMSVAFSSSVPAIAPSSEEPQRRLYSFAVSCAVSIDRWSTRVVLDPASEAMTPAAMPTGPVPPNMTDLQSLSSLPCLALSSFSTQPTRAAAVVKAPLGSANTETSKGGTMACLLVFSMFIASLRSRPPINIAVRLIPAGLREKMAS